MKDVVLIPTYLRPEYLYLCLEYLSKTLVTPSEKEFWVCADSREHDEHRFKLPLEWQTEVLYRWMKVLPMKFFKGTPHNYNGNSYNVLEAYKRALNNPEVRYIYLVEDDVLVTPDFFKWHEAIAEQEPDAMCSVAYRCSRNSAAFKDVVDPGGYFTSAADYASIGVRWSKEKLRPVLDHATPAYYSGQDQYMLTRFAGNRFAGDFAEQDGLIMRVMWEMHGFTVWPYVPRCYHMGWYGYHRPNGFRPNGFLDDKISQIRMYLTDAAKLKFVAPDFGDIEPYNASLNKEFSKLVKLQHFD